MQRMPQRIGFRLSGSISAKSINKKGEALCEKKNNTNLERMHELIERLTEADIAYYKNDAPIMTDLEYDRLTEELAALEHDTGLVLSGSPTQKVSGEILESLAEVRHTKPMLSAGKDEVH